MTGDVLPGLARLGSNPDTRAMWAARENDSRPVLNAGDVFRAFDGVRRARTDGVVMTGVEASETIEGRSTCVQYVVRFYFRSDWEDRQAPAYATRMCLS